MLAAIEAAKTSITFETYIYWPGEIGQMFVDALADRARHHVETHVLLDWLGSAKMEESLLAEMKAAGVQVHKLPCSSRSAPPTSTIDRFVSTTRQRSISSMLFSQRSRRRSLKTI